MVTTLTVATRKSELAKWQTKHVSERLKINDDLHIKTLPITTQGDRFLDTSLIELGGKGLFVKELDESLLDGRADFAVHSIKDIPMEIAAGLTLAAVLPRAASQDAWVSSAYASIGELPVGARVGTASIRRTCQLKAVRQDLNILICRGNVNTRLKKLDEGQFDALILAAAGLERLSFEHRVRMKLPLEEFLPAAGQGAIGVVCRESDALMKQRLAALESLPTRAAVVAERALSRALGGSCKMPLAAHARFENGRIFLEARLYHPYDSERIEAISSDAAACDGEALGIQLAEKLRSSGKDILAALV